MPSKRKDELMLLTKVELVQLAKDLSLSGYSKLSKAQVADLVYQGEKKAITAARKSEARKSTLNNETRIIDQTKVKTEKKRSKINDVKPVKTRTKKETKEVIKKKNKTESKKPHSNGVAIQHPSASPSALTYGRLITKVEEQKDLTYKPVIWPDHSSIPERYGKDKLVTLIRDPLHVVCFWELSHEHLTFLEESVDEEIWHSRRMVLRLFKNTGGLPRLISTIDIFGEIGRYHVEVPEAGASYYTELGFFFSDGRYETVLTDRPLRTPQTRPPRVGPVRWLLVKPSLIRRVVSLETHPVTHPSPLHRTLRLGLSEVVKGRRREFGISDKPASSGSDRWSETEEKTNSIWLEIMKSGKN